LGGLNSTGRIEHEEGMSIEKLHVLEFLVISATTARMYKTTSYAGD
jgi:hypothetical protein